MTNLELGKATTRSKRRITAAFEGTGPDTASPRGWYEGKVPLPETGERRENRAAHAGSCEISSQLALADEHVTAAEPETSQTTDYELGQKAAQGDMAAFEEFYQRYNRRVYSPACE